jgi:hypothetical protein
MTTLERSILINAPSEAIDAITMDGNRLPEWYAGVAEAQPDAIYPQPGGAVDTVYKAAGINFKMKIICEELVQGQKQTLKLEGMITGTNYWTYTPEGEGIRVACKFEYEIPGGGVGKAFDKLIVERMNADNLKKSLTNLKALVEGS